MKYSIVIPTLNNLRYTIEAVESVVKHTEDFELIIVDGGSTDGTWAWLQSYDRPERHFVGIRQENVAGFSSQVNFGLEYSSGDYIIVLNNDVIVTPSWADLLSDAIIEGPGKAAVDRVGLSGPISNSVAGRQAHFDPEYNPSDLDNFALAHRKDNQGQVVLTGFLSGFCMMITRECFAAIGGFNESYDPGGFEDNAYLLKAEAHGFRGVIAVSAFIHHHGSKTISQDRFKHMTGGLHNREKFYDLHSDPRPKKLVAAFRVRNCQDSLPAALDQAATFAQECVVLCDRCTDDTYDVALNHPAVTNVVNSTSDFNEFENRAALLAMAKERNPDWIFVLDHDELPENKFDHAYAQRLMHPPNPHIKCYGFWWYTFWDSTGQHRSDGTFGNIHGFRLFKNEPNQILASEDPLGFHMGAIPQFAPENFRWTNVRIRHTGYVNIAERQRKHQFYSTTDQAKNPMGIGEDSYDHLVAQEVTLKRWRQTNSLAFVIVAKDEYHPLAEHLDTTSYLADQIIVVQTQENSDISALAKSYGAEVYDYDFQNDFSKLRQFAKSKATTDWILTLDPDEGVDPVFLERLPNIIDTDVDGFLTTITNFRPAEPPTTLDSIRLFRHKEDFRYRGIVHENFDESVAKHNLKIVPSPWGINHFGWLRDPESYRVKMNVYKILNKKQMAKYPNDKMAMFNMALHEMEENHYTKAQNLLMKAASLDPAYFPPRVQLTVLHLQQAKQWMQEAIKILPGNHRLVPEMTRALQHIIQAIG